MKTAGQTRFSVIRLAALLLAGSFLALLSLRDHSVRAPRDHLLWKSAALWANHPKLLERRLELEAAHAARRGGAASTSGRSIAERLLVAEPLSTTPLLFVGAEAQLKGERMKADALYAQARGRNPRDPAPRLLLADSLLRAGEVEAGLEELMAIARVSRGSTAPIAPALAEYAKSAGAIANLRPVLERNPQLRDQVLTLLASDPSNAQVVLALAPRSSGARPWEAVLLNSFLQAGDLRLAQALWRRFARSNESGDAITNSTFVEWDAPPPFNWQIFPSAAGLVEYRREGGLAVIYYARDAAEFARQLVLLRPGRYRLRSTVEDDPKSDGLVWRIRCNAGETIAEIPLNEAAEFRIGRECTGQWIELAGKPQDVPATSSVVVRKVGVSWLGE